MILGTLSNDHDDDDNNVKKNWFYEQNNCSAHFLDVHCTSTTETSQCDVLWRTWSYYNNFSLLYLNMDKALKNSTPGKVAYIWRIERYQIVAIKLKGLKFIFLVIVSLPSSSLLKVSFVRRWLACTGPCFKGYLPPPARNCRLESDGLLSGRSPVQTTAGPTLRVFKNNSEERAAFVMTSANG